MKPKTKKLTLGKETLRGLDVRKVEDHELRRVAAGAVQTFGACRCISGLSCLAIE